MCQSISRWTQLAIIAEYAAPIGIPFDRFRRAEHMSITRSSLIHLRRHSIATAYPIDGKNFFTSVFSTQMLRFCFGCSSIHCLFT